MSSSTDKEALKSRFSDGKKPTGKDFSNLIDSINTETGTGSFEPVSITKAVQGSDNTGGISALGLKKHVNQRLATEAEATRGAKNTDGGASSERDSTGLPLLMTPYATKSAFNSLIASRVLQLKNEILGGVETALNTLKKLITHIRANYYTRIQSDGRYDITSTPLSTARIASGSITNDKLGTNIHGDKIKIGSIPSSRLVSGSVGATLVNDEFIKSIFTFYDSSTSAAVSGVRGVSNGGLLKFAFTGIYSSIVATYAYQLVLQSKEGDIAHYIFYISQHRSRDGGVGQSTQTVYDFSYVVLNRHSVPTNTFKEEVYVETTARSGKTVYFFILDNHNASTTSHGYYGRLFDLSPPVYLSGATRSIPHISYVKGNTTSFKTAYSTKRIVSYKLNPTCDLSKVESRLKALERR